MPCVEQLWHEHFVRHKFASWEYPLALPVACRDDVPGEQVALSRHLEALAVYEWDALLAPLHLHQTHSPRNLIQVRQPENARLLESLQAVERLACAVKVHHFERARRGEFWEHQGSRQYEMGVAHVRRGYCELAHEQIVV